MIVFIREVVVKKILQNLLLILLTSLVVTFSNVSQAELAIYSRMDTSHPVQAKHGMVSSQQKLATDIGIEILKRGGNAVDAAVAVGFALAVAYPRAGNIGGGGFMIIHLQQQNKNIAVDYREMAPAKAEKDMMLDWRGNVDREKALFHGLSSGVPGTVMGLELALQKYGTMDLKQVIAPAINLAENGFYVSYDLYNSLSVLKKRLSRWPSTVSIFFKEDGEPYAPGELLIQKDLANTLKLISKKGSKGFYQGEVAKNIAAAIQENGGVMTVQDLANYKAIIRKPSKGTYRGYDIYSMPPPSSGGIHLIQLLNIFENKNIKEMGHNTSATIHQMAEAMKYVYADRSKYLGDPDFVKVPSEQLTSKKYAATIDKKIGPEKVTPSSEIKPGLPIPYESDQTTHYSVLDKWGNAVSNTTTLNFSFGSGLVAASTGVLMNNEMDDFSSKPGSPNAYGLLGGKANAIEAKKRPLSAMTPTIVLKDNKPFLLTGTSGGSRIITTVLQIIMNVIDHDMNISEATQAIRIHHQWFPDEIRIEKGLNLDTINLLIQMGYKIKTQVAMGSTQSILATEDWMFGASDPRSLDGKAAGY